MVPPPVSSDGIRTELSISIAIDASEVSADVRGELDIHSGRRLCDAIEPFTRQEPEELQLDLSGVSFIDSGGVQAILSVSDAIASARGRLVVTRYSDPVEQVFRLLDIPIPGQGRAISERGMT